MSGRSDETGLCPKSHFRFSRNGFAGDPEDGQRKDLLDGRQVFLYVGSGKLADLGQL